MTKKIVLFFVALTLFGAGWDQCYSANEAIERIRMMRSKARTESYLDEGRQDVEKGAYLKAIRVLTEALNRGAGGDEAYELRARAYMGLGNMDSALKDLDRLVSTKPSDSKCYVMRADAENLMEYYDKAISDYDRAIELDPFLQDAYLGRSVSYAAFEKYDLAIRDLELALKIDQRNPEALYNLATICLVADMPKAGREYINRALAADVNAEDRDRLASILAAIPEKSDFEDRKGGIQGVLASLGKQESLTTASRSGNRSRPDLDVPTTDQKKLPYSKKSSQEQDARQLLAKIGKQDFSGSSSGVYMGMRWSVSFSFSGKNVTGTLKIVTPSGKQETHYGRGTFDNGSVQASDNMGFRFVGRVTDDLKLVGTMSTADGQNVSVDVPLQD